MSVPDTLLLLVAYFAVWLPVVVALCARRSPVGVRGVLALSGVISGIYAASMQSRVGKYVTGDAEGWGRILLPVATAALSFWLAFTGVCLLTVLSYVVAGRAKSAPGLLACGLVFGSIALGIFVVFPFLASPLR